MYQQLQQDLDTALREMRRQESEAANLVTSIIQILQDHAGFPREAFWFRADRKESRNSSALDPMQKIWRSGKGAWKLTMDVRIDATTSVTPIQLAAPEHGSHSFTFIPLEITFLDDGRIEIAIEDDSATAIQLSGILETDQRQLADLCSVIHKGIQENIHWVATGAGNPQRRMRFQIN
jgi:hypothetical protein